MRKTFIYLSSEYCLIHDEIQVPILTPLLPGLTSWSSCLLLDLGDTAGSLQYLSPGPLSPSTEGVLRAVWAQAGAV